MHVELGMTQVDPGWSYECAEADPSGPSRIPRHIARLTYVTAFQYPTRLTTHLAQIRKLGNQFAKAVKPFCGQNRVKSKSDGRIDVASRKFAKGTLKIVHHLIGCTFPTVGVPFLSKLI